MSAYNGDGFLRAVHSREYSATAPQGIEVWKYTFPLGANEPSEDLRLRVTLPEGTEWNGSFECARGRHLDVIPWRAANAIVVAAANAVYIVDPEFPARFSGSAAPVEITGVTFDPSARHMFVADSLRIYAFSSDRHFRWMSEPLDGWGARFRACGERVIEVEVNQFDPEEEGEDAAPSVVRLRIEDGSILRPRFRLSQRLLGQKRTAA